MKNWIKNSGCNFRELWNSNTKHEEIKRDQVSLQKFFFYLRQSKSFQNLWRHNLVKKQLQHTHIAQYLTK